MIKSFFRPVGFSLLLIYCYQLVVVAPRAGRSGDLALDLFSKMAVPTLWLDLLLFLLAVLLFAGLWLIALVFTSIGVSRLFKKPDKQLCQAIAFWLSLVFIFALNAYWFPHSVFSWPLLSFAYPYIVSVLGFGWLVILIGGVVSSWRGRTPFRWLTFILLGVALVPLSIPQQKEVNHSNFKRPNIIVIGVDALRPDKVGYYGFQPTVTPNIDQLLKLAKNYTNTYSPMGRTHVAWYSMLEGKYPTNHGLRFNLGESALKDKSIPILESLRKNGYYTIWAIDDRRFNNFSEEYGFDHVVGPKLGAAEFILGLVYDNPLTNWIVNTRIGRWAFPYVHSNRALYKTYNPYVFVNNLVDVIRSAPDKPLFLATHLTLPHYPFLNHMMENPKGWDSLKSSDLTEYRYLSMVQLADKQIGSLVQQLKIAGELDNTVLYLVSDHGEGFVSDKKDIVTKNPYASLNLRVNGHGTNLLNIKQNKVLLARIDFRNIEPGFDSSLHSLIDLEPTLMADAGLKTAKPVDGESLYKPSSPNRMVMMESSFFIEALNQKAINEFQVASESFQFYEVEKNGHLSLKRETLPLLMKSKQYAAISGDYLLLLLPYMDDDAVVLNTKTETWWPLSAHGGDLKSVDYRRLLSAACKYRKKSKGQPLKVCSRASF